MECSLSLSLFLLYRWTMHVSLDETIVIYMVGCLYVELVMYDGTMHVIYMVGWWSYVLDILYVCSVMAFWNIFIYVIYICSENYWIQKNRKKEPICRLFAVCHRRQRALCHQQRTAKRPHGRQLCFLGGWPIWSVCLQWLTAKRKKSLSSAADGKGLPLTT